MKGLRPLRIVGRGLSVACHAKWMLWTSATSLHPGARARAASKAATRAGLPLLHDGDVIHIVLMRLSQAAGGYLGRISNRNDPRAAGAAMRSCEDLSFRPRDCNAHAPHRCDTTDLVGDRVMDVKYTNKSAPKPPALSKLR